MKLALKILCVASGIALLALASGCERSGEPETGGFLGDYSQLEPGPKGGAALLYIRPDADFSPYDEVVIDPVTIWRGAGSHLEDLSAEALEALASELHTALQRELETQFKVVERPGPGTLRIRSAITQAVGPNAVFGGGEVAVEVEILDGASNQRLVAAADKRGGKPGASVDTWEAVQDVFAYWARRITARLAMFRAVDQAEAILGEEAP